MSTLPVAIIGTSSTPTIAQTVGTLKALSRVAASRAQIVGRDVGAGCRHDERADLLGRMLAEIDHDRPLHVGVRLQRGLDLARVDRRALHLEHVVAPAGEEQVPVVVEVPEIAGGVEPVER